MRFSFTSKFRRVDRIFPVSQVSTGKWPCVCSPLLHFYFMGLPTQPVTLDAAQIEQLNRELSTMRHDINNSLSLVLAAVELMRQKPDLTERMVGTIMEQPQKITTSLGKYSTEFEKVFGVTR